MATDPPQQEACVICTEHFTPDSLIAQLNCTHKAHTGCYVVQLGVGHMWGGLRTMECSQCQSRLLPEEWFAQIDEQVHALNDAHSEGGSTVDNSCEDLHNTNPQFKKDIQAYRKTVREFNKVNKVFKAHTLERKIAFRAEIDSTVKLLKHTVKSYTQALRESSSYKALRKPQAKKSALYSRIMRKYNLGHRDLNKFLMKKYKIGQRFRWRRWDLPSWTIRRAFQIYVGA